MKSNILLIAEAVLVGLLVRVAPLFAQGTAFTYQGRLNDGTNLANGSYDFLFKLSPDGTTNHFVGSPSTNEAVVVNNGLFTTTINFGAGIFTGNTYWLAVEVRTNGDSTYTQLLPLQLITPTPYAIFAVTASNLSGSVSATQLSGSISSANIGGIYSNALTFNHPSNRFTGIFKGDGSGLIAINASNLSTGTVPDARLSLNVPLLGASQTFSGANALTNVGNIFTGNGAGLTLLNASSLSIGTVPDSRLSSNVPLLRANQTFSGTNALTNVGNIFIGNGAGLTLLNASSLSTGMVPDARLSSNVPLLGANQGFSGVNALTNVGNIFSGNGAGLTLLNASSLSTGTVPDVRLSSNLALLRANQTFSGVNALTNVGNIFSGNGVGLTLLSASSLSTGTVPDVRLSSNVALLRANQTFSGANALTNSGNTFVGDGGGLTALNASNLASGIVPEARLSSNVPLLNRQTNTFIGTVVAGDVKLANGTQSAVSALDNIRIVRGSVLSNGTRYSGTGFTVNHTNGSGIYRLNFTTAFSDTPTVLATLNNPNIGQLQLATANVGSGSADISISFGSFSTPQDSGFGFVAIGAR
jgi:hypothetical protein